MSVRQIIGKVLFTVRDVANRLKVHSVCGHKNSRYYKLSETCQVRDLDVIYERHFGRRSDGCFVEVGAFDGEYASNTSCLADVGWTGYYIEPVPEYYELCKERHVNNKNVTVSRYAVGAEPGTVEVYVGGPLSTTREVVRNLFDTLDWAKGSFTGKKVSAEQVTLDHYLESQRVAADFELLVVDVEGDEWNVLSAFDIERWRPQMVIIELHDRNDDYLPLRKECDRIVRYFCDNSYNPIHKDTTNTIYVRRPARRNGRT